MTVSSIRSRHRQQHPYATSITSFTPSSSSSSSSFSHMTSPFLFLLLIVTFTSHLPFIQAQCGSIPNCGCDQTGTSCYAWNYTLAPCNYPCAPYNPDASPSFVTLPIRLKDTKCLVVTNGKLTNTEAPLNQYCINTVGQSNSTHPYCNTQKCERTVNGRPWGECNDACAHDGIIPYQERPAADCVANIASPNPTIVLQSYCPPSSLSDTRKNCNIQACKWNYTVGECSVLCGTGQAPNTAKCINSVTGVKALSESNCDSLPKQNSFVPCQKDPCTVWTISVPTFPPCNKSCLPYQVDRIPICYRDGVALPFTRFRECCGTDQTTVNCDTIERSKTCPGEDKYCPTTLPPTTPPTQPPCHSTNNPCSSNGICYLGPNGAGLCRCINGYSGIPSCDIPPSIDTVTVQTQTSVGTPTSVTPGTELIIIWTHTSSMERVSLWLTPFSGVPIYMNMSIPVTSTPFRWTIPNTVPGEISYTVTVSYNATITKSSASFIINEPICAAPCMNGGTCIKGVCSCPSGWQGTTCSLTTCPGCGMYGKCNAGKCECNNGYKGENCQIPPACNIACANGAISSLCQCQCIGYWIGANCSTCNMPSAECFSGGKPNAACNACDCPTIPDAKDVIWTGDKCQLAQLNVRTKVVIPEAQRTEKDSQDFGRLFVQELTSVIGWSRDRVILTKIDVAGNIDMTFIAETSISITNIVDVLNQMVKPKPDVPTVTSPTSRTLGQGYATSKLDPIRDPTFTTSAVTVIPPTQPPSTPKPPTSSTGPALGGTGTASSDSGSSFPIIYVGIGAGALLLIIVIILSIICWRRHRQGYGFSQNVTKLGAQGVSVEIPKELQRGHAQTMANFELSPLASANPKYLASTTGVNAAAFSPPTNQYAIPGPPPEPEGGYGYNGTSGGNEWEERTDEQGYQYWYNNNTGESTWDSPY